MQKKGSRLNESPLIILPMAKIGGFFDCTNKRTKLFIKKMDGIVQRITRECLRTMQNGESITVQCIDGYDLDSQKNTAYAMQKMEKCRFTCKTEGFALTVTRTAL